MKVISFLLLSIAINILGYLPLHSFEAAVELQDIGTENMIESDAKKSPFSASIFVDGVAETEIKNGFFRKDKVKFAIANGEVDFIFYYCPAYVEGANISVGYTATKIQWDQNPWFDQSRFDTLSVSLGGFTKRVNRWFWQGQLTINVDTKEWDVREYANYDFLMWGRYTFSDRIGVHVGLIVETGMKMDRVYPILGMDWQISKAWKLNLIFPLNASLQYAMTQHWSFAVASRFFNVRYRVERDEAFSRALIRYQNLGGEFAVMYNSDNFTINVHAGSTVGGRIRIANRDNHHPRHYRLNPSFYAGVEVDATF